MSRKGPRDFGGEASVPLRRSNRERGPLDRFGDWTTLQRQCRLHVEICAGEREREREFIGANIKQFHTN